MTTKNVFREYKPAFIDSEREPPYLFEDLAELLQAPQVVRFANNESFDYFGQIIEHDGSATLMVASKDKTYWVVGFLASPVDGLAEWKSPR